LDRAKGAVAANPGDIDKANAVNRLLIRPIDLLPCAVGDPVKPFAISVWSDIRLLLQPNTAAIALRRAISGYTHSSSYFYACAQSDAFRHDIDGNAVGPVSAVNRAAAQLSLSKLKRCWCDPHQRHEHRRDREAAVRRATSRPMELFISVGVAS
jgi:ProP effector